MPRVSLVVAVASNGVIGADNDMPWRLPSDLKRFKALTMGKPIVMGRRTYESIGRALPGRLNIVISRQPDLAIAGCTVVSSLKDAFDVAAEQKVEEVCVIGGGQIYAQAMDLADLIYITRVDVAPLGDTHFPIIDLGLWELVQDEAVVRMEKDSADTVFQVYKRI